MNRNYYILTAIMLILAIGTLFIHERKYTSELPASELLWDILQPSRFVTTDQVAKRIIEKDPSLLLIDIRPVSEYNKFSLPNAVNVPFDSIETTNGQQYFGNPGTKVVLFGNDGILANRVWILLRRLDMKNNYVMRGGLNRWVETIIQPKRPKQTDPETSFEQYNFRRAARIYFTGAKVVTGNMKKEKVVFKKRKRAAVAAGGC